MTSSTESYSTIESIRSIRSLVAAHGTLTTYPVFTLFSEHGEVPEFHLNGANFRDRAIWSPFWSMGSTTVQVNIRVWNF